MNHTDEDFKKVCRSLSVKSGGNRTLSMEYIRLKDLYLKADSPEDKSWAYDCLVKLNNRAWKSRW